MRAGSFAGCSVVLATVAVTGCAPFFETGPASPEPPAGAAMYRGPVQAHTREGASDGIYAVAPPVAPAMAAATVEGPAAPVEVRDLPARVQLPPQAPAVFVLRPACCAGPVVVTVACADGSDVGDDEAPPPAPYKPWPGKRAPSLYHDH